MNDDNLNGLILILLGVLFILCVSISIDAGNTHSDFNNLQSTVSAMQTQMYLNTH